VRASQYRRNPGGAAKRAVRPRRKFLQGLVGLIAAPAVVKAEALMPIKVWAPPQNGASPIGASPKLRRLFLHIIGQWPESYILLFAGQETDMTPAEIKRKHQNMLNNEILLAPEIADYLEAKPAHERTEQETIWLQRWRADMADFTAKKRK
jgi:hypothetical protein